MKFEIDNEHRIIFDPKTVDTDEACERLGWLIQVVSAGHAVHMAADVEGVRALLATAPAQTTKMWFEIRHDERHRPLPSVGWAS